MQIVVEVPASDCIPWGSLGANDQHSRACWSTRPGCVLTHKQLDSLFYLKSQPKYETAIQIEAESNLATINNKFVVGVIRLHFQIIHN